MALKVFGRIHVTFSLWGWNLPQKVKENIRSCVNTNHEDIVRVFMENVNGMRKMLFSIYAHFVMIYRACCIKKLQKKLCFAWYQFYKFTFVFLMYETSFMFVPSQSLCTHVQSLWVTEIAFDVQAILYDCAFFSD